MTKNQISIRSIHQSNLAQMKFESSAPLQGRGSSKTTGYCIDSVTMSGLDSKNLMSIIGFSNK